MSAALLGSSSCARCAQLLLADELFCTTCGAQQLTAARGGALSQTGGLLAGVVQASAFRRRSAAIVDMSVALMAALVAAMVAESVSAAAGPGFSATRSAIWAATAAVFIVVLVQLLALGRSGRTIGLRLFALRYVDNLSALPPSISAALIAIAARWRPRSAITADLRRGRDPLTPAHAPVMLAEQAVSTTAPVGVFGLSEIETEARTKHDAEPSAGLRGPRHADRAARDAADGGSIFTSARLVFDSGEEVLIDRPLLVGRNPETDASGTAVHALPDLSRSLSRTHALFDWRDGLLWVTDLNTTNGSAVVDAAGGIRPLVPGLRTAAAIGWRIEIGQRSLEILAGATA